MRRPGALTTAQQSIFVHGFLRRAPSAVIAALLFQGCCAMNNVSMIGFRHQGGYVSSDTKMVMQGHQIILAGSTLDTEAASCTHCALDDPVWHVVKRDERHPWWAAIPLNDLLARGWSGPTFKAQLQPPAADLLAHGRTLAPSPNRQSVPAEGGSDSCVELLLEDERFMTIHSEC